MNYFSLFRQVRGPFSIFSGLCNCIKKCIQIYLIFVDSGSTVSTAIDVLIDSGVEEKNIIVLTLFATYNGTILHSSYFCSVFWY